MLKIYEKCGYNAAETSRQMGEELGYTMNVCTILKYAKEHDYHTNQHGGRRYGLHKGKGAIKPEEEARIIEIYKKSSGKKSKAKIARQTNRSAPLVARVLKEHIPVT